MFRLRRIFDECDVCIILCFPRHEIWVAPTIKVPELRIVMIWLNIFILYIIYIIYISLLICFAQISIQDLTVLYCLTFDSQVFHGQHPLFSYQLWSFNITLILSLSLTDRKFSFILIFRVIAKRKIEYFIKCSGADNFFISLWFHFLLTWLRGVHYQ